MRLSCKVLIAMLSVVMPLSASMAAYAAEPAESYSEGITTETVADSSDHDSDMAPRTTYTYRVGTTSDGFSEFVQLVYKSGGISTNVGVLIEDFNSNDYCANVLMYGKNGLLWRGDDCIVGTNSRVFECGSDVTALDLQITPRHKLVGEAPPRFFTVKVTY